MRVTAERREVDLARISLPSAAIYALARAYVCWERRGYPPTIRDLQLAAQRDDKDTAQSVAGVIALLDRGLLTPNGKGEGDRREVAITPLGIAWFETNCDYWRECNVYRFHSRHAIVGCFEYDPRRPLSRRLLDPLVSSAALAGATLATFAMLLIR